MTGKVLVVDDETSIIALVQHHLEQLGYSVESVQDGKEALNLIRFNHFDLVVLDVMLPNLDGMEICKELRIEHHNVPILMLTAKDDEVNKILGLEFGADDYMTKPFSPQELVARVRALMRRTHEFNEHSIQKEVITIGELEIYVKEYEVYFKGNPLVLTPKEFELLLYLAQHQGQALSRDQLMTALWGYEYIVETRIVDVHIAHLREKLNKHYIKTIRGVGYKMLAD
ncbi:two-component system alkaline phosphatase synthesis response regulator PhoP [Alkalibacillus filiformis]|uniref:Two-component system alkaline phosphatase synthesis response regulator PhoP n=1 Tax=Alkalibacillus filiformis TaxID=200990 RepID=A0ABU0DT13_9BACI|nr:response regulator transcription factor [Alkalibacillus filiformis]MDQ0351603.1 two-component system alkaline phosphatase synthesis response regulator PhoP [Alkalibacillus filiformis]